MGMMLMGDAMLMHVFVRMLVILGVDVLVIVVMVVGNIVCVHIVMIVFVAHTVYTLSNRQYIFVRGSVALSPIYSQNTLYISKPYLSKTA